VVLSAFILCNYYHHPSPEYSLSSFHTETLYVLNGNSPLYSPSAPGNCYWAFLEASVHDCFPAAIHLARVQVASSGKNHCFCTDCPLESPGKFSKFQGLDGIKEFCFNCSGDSPDIGVFKGPAPPPPLRVTLKSWRPLSGLLRCFSGSSCP
jgi:hypothetical protein